MAVGWEHGTIGGYTNHSCRCDPCRQANSVYQRTRRARSPRKKRHPATVSLAMLDDDDRWIVVQLVNELKKRRGVE